MSDPFVAEFVSMPCSVMAMGLRPIRGLVLRRTLLGILLVAGRPLTVSEIVSALHAAGATTLPRLAKPPHQTIADMLAHQVRAGRVLRTRRATYAVISSSMSRSTQRRCRLWRDALVADD